MKDSALSFPPDRKPWNQRWYWIVLALLALVIHYAFIPLVIFPILFVIPVMLAAWYSSGPSFAIGLVIVMSLIRFGFFFLASPAWTIVEAGLNALVRCLVLLLLALLLSRLASQQRALLQRVKTLEGLMRICAYCKRIRDEQGEWKQLEVYIGSRTEAKFTHSYCPECVKQHFGDLSAKNGNA